MEKKAKDGYTMISGYPGIVFLANLARCLNDFSENNFSESYLYTVGGISAIFLIAVLIDIVKCKKQSYRIIQVIFMLTFIASTVCYLYFQTKMYGIIMAVISVVFTVWALVIGHCKKEKK